MSATMWTKLVFLLVSFTWLFPVGPTALRSTSIWHSENGIFNFSLRLTPPAAILNFINKQMKCGLLWCDISPQKSYFRKWVITSELIGSIKGDRLVLSPHGLDKLITVHLPSQPSSVSSHMTGTAKFLIRAPSHPQRQRWPIVKTPAVLPPAMMEVYQPLTTKELLYPVRGKKRWQLNEVIKGTCTAQKTCICLIMIRWHEQKVICLLGCEVEVKKKKSRTQPHSFYQLEDCINWVYMYIQYCFYCI